MALIKCVDCGREISDAAPTCLGCGRSSEEALAAKDPLLYLGNLCLGWAVLMGLIMWWTHAGTDVPWNRWMVYGPGATALALYALRWIASKAPQKPGA